LDSADHFGLTASQRAVEIGESASSILAALADGFGVRRGTVGRFILQDPKPSIFGSEGSATYTYCDASLAMQTVVFSYECPTGFTDNRAASSQADWPCVAKSGDPNGPWSGQVPGAGHPLYAAYVAGDGEPNEGKRRQVTRTGKDSRDD